MMYEEYEIAALGLEDTDRLAREVRQLVDSLYAEEEEHAHRKVMEEIQSATIDLKTRFEALDIPAYSSSDTVIRGDSLYPTSPLHSCGSQNGNNSSSNSLNNTPIAEKGNLQFELLSTSSSYRSLGTSIDTATLFITESSK